MTVKLVPIVLCVECLRTLLYIVSDVLVDTDEFEELRTAINRDDLRELGDGCLVCSVQARVRQLRRGSAGPTS